MRIAKTVL